MDTIKNHMMVQHLNEIALIEMNRRKGFYVANLKDAHVPST